MLEQMKRKVKEEEHEVILLYNYNI